MAEKNAPDPVPLRRFLDWKPGDPFRPLEPTIRTVHFGRAMTEEELVKTGRLLAPRPDVTLAISLFRSADLGFLRHFPGLRHLGVNIYELDSIEGLSCVRDTLKSFNFGKTKKTFPLGFLGGMPRLRTLHIEGHGKGIEALGGLVDLTHLGLRGLTLPDLSLLLPLRKLRGLSLHLGGTSDLRLLPRLAELEEIGLLRINGLSDLSMLADLSALKSLTLDWMKNVTELPSFGPLRNLESISMETMKGIASLAPIAAAPALRSLEIVNMPQLKPADYACLVGHPTLRKLGAFPGGWKAHDAIAALFPGIAR